MKLTLPASLEPRRAEIEQLIELRSEQFYRCCVQHQPGARCAQALNKPRTIQVIDDFRFPLAGHPRGLANGQWLQNGKLIKVCLYNIHSGYDSGVHTRTREQMSAYAKGKQGKKYWLAQPFLVYSANVNDLLPGLKHELQHYFGRNKGHGDGTWDCQ